MDLSRYKVENAPDTVYYIPDFISEQEEQALLAKVYTAPRTKWTVLSHRRLQNWGGLPGPKGMVGEDLPQWLSTYSQKISDLGAFEGNRANHVLVNEYLSGQGIMPHEDGPAFYPTVSTISLGSHTLLDFYLHLTAASRQGHITVSGQGQSTASLHEQTTTSDQGRTSAVNVPCGQMQREQQAETERGVGADSQEAEEQGLCGCSEDSNQDAGDTSFASRHFASLLLQPRSLVVLQDDMYKTYLHGIAEVSRDIITDKVANLPGVQGVQVGDVMDRGTRVSLTIRYVPKVLKSKLIFGKR